MLKLNMKLRQYSSKYNETLDSGTIILPHLSEIEIGGPYDVIVIFSRNEY